MVKFASWTDRNLFVKEYMTCSCLNCVGWHGELDSAQFVCMRTLSPVRMDMINVCVEWEDKDGHQLKDFKEYNLFKFSDEIADKIESMPISTFEELKEVIENEHP